MTDILISTRNGKILRINSEDIPLSRLVDKKGRQKSHKPTGVKLIDLKENDAVVDICSYSYHSTDD